jgi:hypothetical protein
MLETSRTGNAIPTFAFLNIPATAKYNGSLDPQILSNVKRIVAPAVVLKPNLISALEKQNLLDPFINSMSVVIEHSNHDFVHGLTNATRDKRISEGFDFKAKTYLRDFRNPAKSQNGFRVEECAVVEMNRLIFEQLRAQPNNASITEFSNAVDDVAGVITALEQANEREAARSARSLLKNFLSFFFDKKLLDETPVNEWKNIVRTAETRQDIRLCQYTTSPMFEPMGVYLGGRKTELEVDPRKQTMTPKENDAYCAHLLEEGTLKEAHPADVFGKLAEAVAYDLRDDGMLLRSSERTAIRNAAASNSHASNHHRRDSFDGGGTGWGRGR